MKENQTNRFSDEELSAIKSIFAENLETVEALRKLFLDFPLDVVDIGALTFFKEEINKKVLRKAFLPKIETQAPLQQMVDLWLTLKVDDKHPEEAINFILARELLLELLEERFNKLDEVLAGKELSEITTLNSLIPSKEKSPAENYVHLLARNTIVTHSDQQLTMFYMLAGKKDETIEETRKRLQKNSTK